MEHLLLSVHIHCCYITRRIGTSEQIHTDLASLPDNHIPFEHNVGDHQSIFHKYQCPWRKKANVCSVLLSKCPILAGNGWFGSGVSCGKIETTIQTPLPGRGFIANFAYSGGRWGGLQRPKKIHLCT